jgi:hypothetical protein
MSGTEMRLTVSCVWMDIGASCLNTGQIGADEAEVT